MVLIPMDGVERVEAGKPLRRGGGTKHYRRGFQRIPREKFAGFGCLVNARYVFVYAETKQCLNLYLWANVHASDMPLLTFSGGS